MWLLLAAYGQYLCSHIWKQRVNWNLKFVVNLSLIMYFQNKLLTWLKSVMTSRVSFLQEIIVFRLNYTDDNIQVEIRHGLKNVCKRVQESGSHFCHCSSCYWRNCCNSTMWPFADVMICTEIMSQNGFGKALDSIMTETALVKVTTDLFMASDCVLLSR